MRKKNRQMKVTFDIPDYFDDEETFLLAFRDRLDGEKVDWKMSVENSEGDNVPFSVSKITLGDIEIEPEEGE